MTESVQENVLSYMRRHNTMTLATCSGDKPWAAAVFYVNLGFKLYFLSEETTRHSLNLTENELVAVTINEDYKNWKEIKGVQLEGTVRVLEGKLETSRVMAAYLKKYPFVASLSNQSKFSKLMKCIKVYCVNPNTIWFLDNALGFSNRQKLELDI